MDFGANIVCFMSSLSSWESPVSVGTDSISGFYLCTIVKGPHGQFLGKTVCICLCIVMDYVILIGMLPECLIIFYKHFIFIRIILIFIILIVCFYSNIFFLMNGWDSGGTLGGVTHVIFNVD